MNTTTIPQTPGTVVTFDDAYEENVRRVATYVPSGIAQAGNLLPSYWIDSSGNTWTYENIITHNPEIISTPALEPSEEDRWALAEKLFYALKNNFLPDATDNFKEFVNTRTTIFNMVADNIIAAGWKPTNPNKEE